MHMDIPELRTEQGKAYLFVVLDRATKYVYGEIWPDQTAENVCCFACLFLKNLKVLDLFGN